MLTHYLHAIALETHAASADSTLLVSLLLHYLVEVLLVLAEGVAQVLAVNYAPVNTSAQANQAAVRRSFLLKSISQRL